jgi:hypothetical protein
VVVDRYVYVIWNEQEGRESRDKKV